MGGLIKKAAALILIAGSAIFAVLIISDGRQQIITKETAETARPAPEKIPEVKTPETNLTQETINQISGEIISADTLKNNSDPEEIADKYLSQAIQSFDYNYFKPEVKQSRLNIINDSGPEIIGNYLKNFNQIAQKFGWLKLPDARPDNLNKLTDAYAQIIDEFYQLAVPTKLAYIHQQIISLLSGQKLALEKISNYQTDPLQALLAFEAAEKLNEELAILQKTLINLLKSS